MHTCYFYRYEHIRCGQGVLYGSDHHDLILEFFIWNKGSVLDAGFVGVNSIHGVFEDLCNSFIVMNAHPDKCKDPEIGI